MHFAQPQLREEEWVIPFNRYLAGGDVAPAEWAKIEGEASAALGSKDPIVRAVAHQALGLLATVRRDRKAMYEQFGYAIVLDATATRRLNFALAASDIGDSKLVREQAERVFRDYPDDVSALRRTEKLFVQSGNFYRAEDVHRRLTDLGKVPEGDAGFDALGRFVARARREQVPIEKLTDLFDTANAALRAKGLRPQGVNFSEGEGGAIFFRFVCDASVEKLVEADFAIAHAIVARHDQPLDELITFGTMRVHHAG